MKSKIEMEMTFDAGHRIVDHKGKCARLHGHTYRVKITMTGDIVQPGFVVDFGDIKDLVNLWDHQLLLWEQDPVIVGLAVPLHEGTVGPSADPDWLEESESQIGVVRLPFNPTAENMAGFLATKIQNVFRLDLVTVQLWETPKASATAQATRVNFCE